MESSNHMETPCNEPYQAMMGNKIQITLFPDETMLSRYLRGLVELSPKLKDQEPACQHPRRAPGWNENDSFSITSMFRRSRRETIMSFKIASRALLHFVEGLTL